MVDYEIEFNALDKVNDDIREMIRSLDRKGDHFLAKFDTLVELDAKVYVKKLECLTRR